MNRFGCKYERERKHPVRFIACITEHQPLIASAFLVNSQSDVAQLAEAGQIIPINDLIDQCVLKGYAVGGAQVSMKHAGFLINNGESSRDFFELIEKVQQIVEERVGVKLEPDIRIVGEETEA